MILLSRPARGLFLAVLLLLAASRGASGQRFVPAEAAELIPAPGLLNNSVSNLHLEGDTLWVGPYLNLTTDRGATWQLARADSLTGSANRVFSIDVEGPVVWVGLGTSFQETIDGQTASIPTAAGFLVSRDGGRTFAYRFPPLDAAADTVEVYGASRLKALPILVPQQSPPYDIDYDPDTGTLWMAGWASGVRRSTDEGRTWRRVVLPPDDLEEIRPDGSYSFLVNPRGGQVDPVTGKRGNYNHTGFSVLVDEAGVVWAGTAAGLNRSEDGGASWRRFHADGTPGSLTGSWVVSVEEQPLPGRNPVWIASWSAAESGERSVNGITVTRDGGATFEQVLLGERVIDFAFAGETVYAAGRESGLFVSADGGRSWRTVRDFHDPTRPERPARPNLDVTSVAAADGIVWVGTADGLYRSTDGAATWRVFSAEVPLHPAEPTDAVPDVDTYAYPNPFSPAADTFVRLRFEAAADAPADIRIYDFGMHLVRRLDDPGRAAGAREVTWDGTDADGLRVANGPYFYAVRTGSETVWGKILVLE